MENKLNTQYAGLGLIKACADVIPDLTYEQLLYLARNKDALKEMLAKAPADLVVAKGVESIVPALESITTKKALQPSSPYAKNGDNLAQGIEILGEEFFAEDCIATKECLAVGAEMLCALNRIELVYTLGVENVETMIFTVAQVRHLAQEQNAVHRTGPLDFKQSNYFFVRGKNGDIRIMVLWWRGSQHNKNSKNMWHYWIPKHDDKVLKQESTLVYCQY